VADSRSPARLRLWLAASGAVALVVASSWLLSYPGGRPDGVLPSLLAALLLVVWAAVAAWWLFSFGRVLFRRITRKRGATRLWLLACGALVLALGATIASGASLRLRFELSESALERVAKNSSNAPWRDGPGRTGLYDVRAVTSGSGRSIVLITNSCGPVSDCGFAYSPSGAPPDVCADSDYQVYSHIAGPWYAAQLAGSGPCG
jgi:hypothetical protein